MNGIQIINIILLISLLISCENGNKNNVGRDPELFDSLTVLVDSSFFVFKNKISTYKKYNSISDALINRNSVKYLDLSGRNFRNFPNKIFLFKNLEILELSGNSIKRIPKEIVNLKKLRILELGSNYISEIPVYIKALSSLEELNLVNNDILIVPDEICFLVSLKKLNLNGNSINKVSDCVDELLALEYLGLGNSSLDIRALELIQNKILSVKVDF